MAAAVARDLEVRAAFDAIGWTSVGQNPSILEMQRILYLQFLGEMMPVKEGATPVAQLGILQAVSIGRKWLLVLDGWFVIMI